MKPVKNFDKAFGSITHGNLFRFREGFTINMTLNSYKGRRSAFWLKSVNEIDHVFLCEMIWERDLIQISKCNKGAGYVGDWIGNNSFTRADMRDIASFHSYIKRVVEGIRNMGYEL